MNEWKKDGGRDKITFSAARSSSTVSIIETLAVLQALHARKQGSVTKERVEKY